MEYGADPCSRNLFGKTPIQLASHSIQQLILDYLDEVCTAKDHSLTSWLSS